jgi:hypothetical protein
LQQKEKKDKKGKNSCFDGDFKNNKKEFILLSDLKRLVISRSFVTQNQLYVKYTRESKETKQEKVKTKLFCLY